MRIVAHRGNKLNAPENTYFSLVSAYTSGINVLEFDVQLTSDDKLVVSHDGTINRMCGIDDEPIKVIDKTLKQLRWEDYDFSRGFNPNNIEGFQYYDDNRKLQIEELAPLIDRLPLDIDFLIELKHDSMKDQKTRKKVVDLFCEVVRNKIQLDRLVVYSKDHLSLRLLRKNLPGIRTCVFNWEIDQHELLDLLINESADGMVIDLFSIYKDRQLTEFGKQFKEAFKKNNFSLGAVIYPYRSGLPGIFLPEEYNFLKDQPFVWSLSTDSSLQTFIGTKQVDLEPIINPSFTWLEESFNENELNLDLFAFGYAKGNKYCLVELDNGVKIQLDEYNGYLPLDPVSDPIKERLNNLEFKMLYAQKSWPFYSGGGFGVIQAIKGNFVATVEYELEKPLTQAQTMEMALTNVDPARHRSQRPKSLRDADPFYDPHGCPPYFGIEHDENDGYRINWNLGAAYENNQYGSPVGDGLVTTGVLRLERRGSYFSGYYKNDNEAPTWVCVGAVENGSLNEAVYLRCVAKRWLQKDGNGYYPVEDNVIRFKNLKICKSI